ncbi:hypothetical protein LCGC14_0341450 [marine sediment metagenome]|uniref:Uncharacterized protein n=1 Tax=marine sediment metagenome TaxID=412755 RepID=A0A0F9WLC9_9ZZZZ
MNGILETILVIVGIIWVIVFLLALFLSPKLSATKSKNGGKK